MKPRILLVTFLLSQLLFNGFCKTQTIDIYPRKNTFRIGDTVSFGISCSEAYPGSYIEVSDPDGNIYWVTDRFTQQDWITANYLYVGTVYEVPYYVQLASDNLMILLDDAPLGEWSWIFYNQDNGELETGTFVVEISSEYMIVEQLEDLNNKLANLEDYFTDVASELDAIKEDMADTLAIAQQATNTAQQAIEATQTVAQTANQANIVAENAAEQATKALSIQSNPNYFVYFAVILSIIGGLFSIVNNNAIGSLRKSFDSSQSIQSQSTMINPSDPLFEKIVVNKITELGTSTYHHLGASLGVTNEEAETLVYNLRLLGKVDFTPCLFCPSCNFINDRNLINCSNCGTSLGNAEPGYSQGTILW